MKHPERRIITLQTNIGEVMRICEVYGQCYVVPVQNGWVVGHVLDGCSLAGFEDKQVAVNFTNWLNQFDLDNLISTENYLANRQEVEEIMDMIEKRAQHVTAFDSESRGIIV